MTTTPSLKICFVSVSDQDEALTFYRDVLGFEVRSDVPFDQYRWLTVSPPSQPGIELNLENPRMGRSAEDADAILALVAKGSMPALIMETEDLDGLFEKLRAAKTEVIQEPIDQPYGVRDCAFRDPAGNHLRFSQTLAG